MGMAKEKDKKKPDKVGLYAAACFAVPLLTFLIPFETKKYEDPSTKVIQFHLMKNLTDPQPTLVRRKHRLTDAVLSI